MRSITYRQETRSCGKGTCSVCGQGPGHGPYWYAYWRDNQGRRRSRYLGASKPSDLTVGASGNLLVPPPDLHIRLIGGLRVTFGNRAIPARAFERASARKLLALLALHPRGLSRDQVIEMLCPDASPTSGKNNVKTTLSALRHTLQRDGPARTKNSDSEPRLPGGAEQIRLVLFPRDYVDAQAMLGHDNPAKLEQSVLEELITIGAGELLPEFLYEDWTQEPREQLRRRRQALQLELAHRRGGSGQEMDALNHLTRLVEDDPTHEAGARLMMSILARQGRRDRALHAYRNLERSLRDELGVEPDEVSVAMARRIAGAASSSEARRPASKVVMEIRESLANARRTPLSPESRRRSGRLWADLALAEATVGETESALASVESGQRSLESLDAFAERSRLYLAEATIQLHRGHAAGAYEAALEAGMIATRASDRGLEAWALRLKAQACQQLGRSEEALTSARSSVALYDAIGAHEHALRSRRTLAFIVWSLARFPEATRLQERNLEDSLNLQDIEQQAYILCGLGSALYPQGKLEEAERYLTESLALADRLEDHYLALSAEYHLANLWVERAFVLGDERQWQAAREMARNRFERAMLLAQEQESDVMMAFCAVDLAAALVEWEEPEEADVFFTTAKTIGRTVQTNPSLSGWLLLTEARLLLHKGNAMGAEERAQEAIEILESSSPAGLAAGHRIAAEACRLLDRTGDADRHRLASLSAAQVHGQTAEHLRTEGTPTAVV